MSKGQLSRANLERYEGSDFDARESRIEKVVALLRELRPRRLLDLACGNGHIVRGLAVRPELVVGCDIALGNVQIAMREAGICGAVSNLNDDLPFASRSFDCILAGEIIEHLLDTDRFLGECHRVLEVGGHLLLTTPNLASMENRLRLLAGLYPIWVDYSLHHGNGHVRAYTAAILRRQLTRNGFEVLRCIGNFVPFLPQRFLDDRRFNWLKHTGDWLPGLSQDIIILSRRLHGDLVVDR